MANYFVCSLGDISMHSEKARKIKKKIMIMKCFSVWRGRATLKMNDPFGGRKSFDMEIFFNAALESNTVVTL